MSPTKEFFAFFLAAFFVVAAGSNAFSQCGGVYLRHASTQSFPYAKVNLDHAADMNGDGKPDLLATQYTGPVFSRDRIFVIPNNGNGTFGTPTVIDPPSGRFNYEYFVGRVNNDAANDIIAYPDFGSGFEPPSIIVYLNNGNGTFGAPVISQGSSARGKVRELVDVNNDGKNDYISFTGGAVFNYSLGNGDGTFGPPVEISNNDGAAGAVDFNNDGKIDFINGRHVYINNGNGTFTSNEMSQYLAPDEGAYLVRDLNGDGLTDILASTSGGGWRLRRKTGTGFDSTDYPGPGPGDQPLYQVGFFNGDSNIDIIVSYRNENRKVVFTTDATGALTRSEQKQRFYYYNFLNKVYADFDGDGREDVVEMTSKITNSHIILDVTSLTFLKNVCDLPGQPRIVDFDATRNTDYSFWNPATGDWSWRANPYDNETNQTETVNWGLGSHGDIPTPGDFDGDGVTDRAVFRNSTGVWYIRRSSDLAWYVLPFGLSGDKPVVADYDGDTISDIAVWRPSDGTWYIWYMGSQTYAIRHFGLDGDKPAPADFDGDLKADIAVFRPSTGVWYTLNSSNGAFGFTQWGSAGDRPMAADYDGDGKADIAVFRESNRFMYIVRSTNAAIVYYWVGYTGDIPQIGDYDGDFVADIGFYQPSTRLWYTNEHGALFGANNVIPTSSMIPAE